MVDLENLQDFPTRRLIPGTPEFQINYVSREKALEFVEALLSSQETPRVFLHGGVGGEQEQALEDALEALQAADRTLQKLKALGLIKSDEQFFGSSDEDTLECFRNNLITLRTGLMAKSFQSFNDLGQFPTRVVTAFILLTPLLTTRVSSITKTRHGSGSAAVRYHAGVHELAELSKETSVDLDDADRCCTAFNAISAIKLSSRSINSNLKRLQSLQDWVLEQRSE